RFQLQAPRLEGIDVQQTLWTVDDKSESNAAAAPHGNLVASASDHAAVSSVFDAEVARLQAVSKALEAIATAQSSSLPPAVLAESFDRWRGAIANSGRRLAQSQVPVGRTD